MSRHSGHPSKAMMLRAIRDGTTSIQKHLRECESCRTQFELLGAIPSVQDSSVQQPTDDALERYASVPLLFGPEKTAGTETGAIDFDSWADQPIASLRTSGPGLTRRLCLKAREVSLEILAERHRDHWEFTARVYVDQSVSCRWMLQVGGRRMLCKSLGFYHWSSKNTPRIVRLAARSRRIEFTELAW